MTDYIYIMSNIGRTVLYVGVTNDLSRRVEEHRLHLYKGFTDNYKCEFLIYFESTDSIVLAIEREKQIKKWSRDKKESLIKQLNPSQADLSHMLEMT